MSALQRLFDRLVGIGPNEALLHHQAALIFNAPAIDVGSLQKPACWRRRAHVRRGRRQGG